MSSLPANFKLSSSPPDESQPPGTQPGSFHLMSYGLGLLTSLFLVGGVLLLLRHPDPPPIVLHPPPPPAPTATPLPSTTPAPITVFVSGAVQKPGLYNLPVDARVGEALALAGGFTASANAVLINQAEKLRDGVQIHVPDLNEQALGQPPAGISAPAAPVAAAADTTGGSQPAGGLINLNTATAAELDALPGIGPSRAEAIIAHRPYSSVDELDNVPGIGPSILEQLRPLVTAQ